MSKKLHLDIETFSSVDIRKSGAYKYCQSFDFEIILLAYAFDNDTINIIDLYREDFPEEFIEALHDPKVEKHAHNANFERNAFRAIGHDIPTGQWHCSAVKSAYCGLPLSLGGVSEALELEEKGKLSTGSALIRYFCIPCKPTKTNGKRFRNMPEHDMEKWEEFKRYCINDVEAEREIGRLLSDYEIPHQERHMYLLDQEINDRGIKVDEEFVTSALHIDAIHSEILGNEIKDLTGVSNPNSAAQLKKWIGEAMGREIKSLAKDVIPDLIEVAESDTVRQVLKLRQKASKTSIKKYDAMLNCVCESGRVHGLFQFYGANRTGRWAGRLVQLQNLPQNHIENLDLARDTILTRDYELATLLYGNVSGTLSELIRTAFVAKKGYTFAVADFSAIEARVIAWLAGEEWRMEVFRSHGKIYEASASKMFSIPIEEITKGSGERQKGKIAELALGYGGSVGALMQMGGESMGLGEAEMRGIVHRWRKSNPAIVLLWTRLEQASIRAVKTRSKVILKNLKGMAVESDGKVFTILLPSGRKLYYQSPSIGRNQWGAECLMYKGTVQATRKWGNIDTYGGKLTENVIQAIARDLLAFSMINLNSSGFGIVMHVHDEAVAEVPKGGTEDKELDRMCHIMSKAPEWAQDLPLTADGYITDYYRKD